MKKLLLSFFALGMLLASTAAQAHSREYYENKYYQQQYNSGYYPAPDYRYAGRPNYYPASCYYEHEDALGHHTWRVRKECRQPQPQYYAPRPTYYYPDQYRNNYRPGIQLNLFND